MEAIEYLKKYYRTQKTTNKDKLEEVSTRRHYLKDRVKKILRRHPEYRKMTSEKAFQIGGGPLQDRIDQLKKAIKQIKGFDLSKMKDQVDKVEIQLQEFEDALNAIDPAKLTNLQGLTTKNDLYNNLEIGKLVFDSQNAATAIDANFMIDRFNAPVLVPIKEKATAEQLVTYQRMLADRETDLQQMENDTSKTEDEMAEWIRIQNLEMDKIMVDLEAKLENLEKLEAYFTVKNKELEEKLKFPVEERDITPALIHPFENLLVLMDECYGRKDSYGSPEISGFLTEYWIKRQLYPDEIEQVELAEFLNNNLMVFPQDVLFDGLDATGVTIPYPTSIDSRIDNSLLTTRMSSSLEQMEAVLKSTLEIMTGSPTTPDEEETLKDQLKIVANPRFTATSVMQAGGGFAEELPGYVAKLNQMSLLKDQYAVKSYSVTNLVMKFNELHMEMIHFLVFLILILTNQLVMSGYMVYDFVNRGLLQFYYAIVVSIHEKIMADDQDHLIVFIKKYYSGVIKALLPIGQVANMMGKESRILVSKTTGNLQLILHLLNHFKPILESYDEMSRKGMSIYLRLNNFGKWAIKPTDDPDVDRANEQNLVEKMTFASETDLSRARELDEMGDYQKLVVNPTRCPGIDRRENDEYFFTNIFGREFIQNNEIAKYMTMGTMLSKGKGLLLLTYGYSGVGKTYTLFGNPSLGLDGIIQASLKGIPNLRRLKIRFYEIYGNDCQYSDYTKKQHMFHYPLTVDATNNMLKIAKPDSTQDNKTGAPIFIKKQSGSSPIIYADDGNTISITLPYGDETTNTRRMKQYVADGIIPGSDAPVRDLQNRIKEKNAEIRSQLIELRDQINTIVVKLNRLPSDVDWSKEYRGKLALFAETDGQTKTIIQEDHSSGESKGTDEGDSVAPDTIEVTIDPDQIINEMKVLLEGAIHDRTMQTGQMKDYHQKLTDLFTDLKAMLIAQGALDSALILQEQNLAQMKKQGIANLIGTEYESSFLELTAQEADRYLANMSKTTEQIDQNRKRNRRIVRTFNNPESSRSIMIMECLLVVVIDGVEQTVPLVMIDPPGREEIIATYKDAMLNKVPSLMMGNIIPRARTTVNKPTQAVTELNEKFPHVSHLGAIFVSACINPLMFPLFCNQELTQFFNEFDERDRNYVFNTKVLNQWNNQMVTIGDDTVVITTRQGQYSGHKPINQYIVLDSTTHTFGALKPKAMTEYRTMRNGEQRIRKFGPEGFAPAVEDNTYYIRGLIGVALFLRLIALKRYDLVGRLIMKMMDKYYNTEVHKMVTKVFSYDASRTISSPFVGNLDAVARENGHGDWREYLVARFSLREEMALANLAGNATDYLEDMLRVDGDGKYGMNLLKVILKYDYQVRDEDMPNTPDEIAEYFYFTNPMAPFEGVYINEIINGFIRYLLLDKQFGDKGESYVNKHIKQMTSKKAKDWHWDIRNIFRDSFQITRDQGAATHPAQRYYNIQGDTEEMVHGRQLSLTDAGEKLLFMVTQNLFKHPFDAGHRGSDEKTIMKYLEDGVAYRSGSYMEDKSVLKDLLSHYLSTGLVKEFMMMYLMTNDLKKCSYQDDLLRLTKPFIEGMVYRVN